MLFSFPYIIFTIFVLHVDVDRFAVISACLIGSTVAFVPASSSRSTKMTTTMMAGERSKSLPFLLQPSKVLIVESPLLYHTLSFNHINIQLNFRT